MYQQCFYGKNYNIHPPFIKKLFAALSASVRFFAYSVCLRFSSVFLQAYLRAPKPQFFTILKKIQKIFASARKIYLQYPLARLK
jgi:hypothetical protein